MILSISLVIILHLFSQGLQTVGISEDYTRAAFYAKEKMEEILIYPALAEGEWSGACDEDFKWRVTIKNTSEEDESKESGLIIFDILIDVTWPDGAQDRSYQLQTLKTAELLSPEDELFFDAGASY